MSGSKLVIGVDEAGYGPSMGPMTIGATAWRVPIGFDATQMTSLLEPEFLAKPIRPNSTHVPIGDSKKIHREALAVEGLILGSRFLAFAIDGVIPGEWDAQIGCYAKMDWERIRTVPWYVKRFSAHTDLLNRTIPDQQTYFEAGLAKMKQYAIELVGARMRVMDEMEFNREVDRTGNKSTLLGEASLALVKQVITEFAITGECVEVYCDKHGGRNRYQSILTFAFDEEWFETQVESRACSRYTANWSGHAMQIQFKVDGDSIFPSAAASILAKWKREELMDRLNGFWQSKLAGDIVRTAGYYVDAVRFAGQIEETATKLGLSRELWWRKK
jgi:ribonuclease HII